MILFFRIFTFVNKHQIGRNQNKIISIISWFSDIDTEFWEDNNLIYCGIYTQENPKLNPIYIYIVTSQ
jgi:hypothetical protein